MVAAVYGRRPFRLEMLTKPWPMTRHPRQGRLGNLAMQGFQQEDMKLMKQMKNEKVGFSLFPLLVLHPLHVFLLEF
jgi:hypothetical protein